ncbi:hypothetical protein D3C87_152200 [compost metagenome]
MIIKNPILFLGLFLLFGCNYDQKDSTQSTVLKVPRFEALKIENNELIIVGKDLDKKCNGFKFQIIMDFFFVDNNEYDELDLTLWCSRFNFLNDSTWKVDLNFIDSITSVHKDQLNQFLSSDDPELSNRQKNSSRYSKSSFKKFIALVAKNQVNYTLMMGVNDISGEMYNLKTGKKIPLLGYYSLNSTRRGNTSETENQVRFVRMVR